MNRRDFQRLSETRLEDARILLLNRRYAAAYYLCGYAVECGLKACIARQAKRHEFPPERRFIDDVYSHDFGKLVARAGLNDSLVNQIGADPNFGINWGIVKGWSERSRYEAKRKQDAEALFRAVSDPASGVGAWLRLHW